MILNVCAPWEIPTKNILLSSLISRLNAILRKAFLGQYFFYHSANDVILDNFAEQAKPTFVFSYRACFLNNNII